jgi:hypothetical protein
MTAAAMASPLSNPVKPTATGIMGRGTAEGAGAGLTEVAGAAMRAGAAPEAGGAGGAAALDGAGTPTTVAAGAAEPMAGGGVPGAKVGSFIVGAEVGLGGRLMRTVSFFGWTFAASADLGGKAPPGDIGLLSAIISLFCF